MKIIYSYLPKLIFFLFLTTGSTVLKSADKFPLFESDEIFNIEIRTDFSAIQQDRTTTPEYHEGILTYHIRGQKKVSLSVRIMARGNFRRDTSHCSFPPLYVNFREKEVKNTVFENQDRIKLVTPCQDDEDVIDEYLIYKMYNKVTDLSFRVRLVKVLYFDTGAGEEIFEKYSFFLEENDHMAERNNGSEKDRFVTPFGINSENFKKMALFQFMIGNKDWFVTSRQNIILVYPKNETDPPVAVPYDFDLSSFVNAAYTKPKGVPDIYLSKRRIYKGYCLPEPELEELFSYFRTMRPVFESIISKNRILSAKDKEYLLQYIGYFYTITGNSDLIRSEILSTCESKKSYNIPE